MPLGGQSIQRGPDEPSAALVDDDEQRETSGREDARDVRSRMAPFLQKLAPSRVGPFSRDGDTDRGLLFVLALAFLKHCLSKLEPCATAACSEGLSP